MPSLASLEFYITKEQPFGAIDSAQISDFEVLDLFFERQNRAYKLFQSRPSIIMGRRGAGKTSYLKSVYFQDQYQYYAEIITPKAIQYISGVIQHIRKENLYVEIMSELWEKTLLTCVIVELCKWDFPALKNSDIINKYLEGIGVQQNDSTSIVLSKLDTLYREVMAHSPQNGVSEILKNIDSINFEGAKLVAVESLRAVDEKFVILLDSLEEFRIGDESIEHAFKGLLHLSGSMNNPKDVIDIRLCLTTELTPVIYEVSSNALKDFKRMVKLEWTATDLVLIGAQRLMYFLGLYYPELIRGKSPFERLNRASALNLFKKVLPEKIINHNNFQEITISYILRHTQLLPRHFLMLLNSIFQSTFATQSSDPFPATNEKILYGIRQVEEKVVQEIFSTFYIIHPDAKEACRRCLPELKKIFTLGGLQRVYTRHGKAIYTGGEFTDFYRMLVDIGAIGKVSAESDLYITGKFQYAIGHELNLSYDDDLCVHPLFSGIYGGSSSDDKRPIYPEGNGLDD